MQIYILANNHKIYLVNWYKMCWFFLHKGDS